MKLSLKGMSEKELVKLRSDVDAALSKIHDKKRDEALKAASAAAQKFGYDLGELVGKGVATAKRATTKAKSKSAAKYCNPADASQTWTGRGRQPAWFKDALASGKSPEDMLA